MNVRGVRPAEYLFQHDFLSPRLVAAHCRFMTPGEIAHLGRSRGCTIGMGTDNMAHDMLRAPVAGRRAGVGDARRPHLVPALRIVSAWIHNGQAGDVESVMVDGRQLVERYPNGPFPITLPPPVSRAAVKCRDKRAGAKCAGCGWSVGPARSSH
jgi:cytosine/adenosine deaminase-related metal-dependent hydrolase